MLATIRNQAQPIRPQRSAPISESLCSDQRDQSSKPNQGTTPMRAIIDLRWTDQHTAKFDGLWSLKGTLAQLAKRWRTHREARMLSCGSSPSWSWETRAYL